VQVIASADAPIVSFTFYAPREAGHGSAEPTKVSVATTSVVSAVAIVEVPVTVRLLLTIDKGVWAVSVAVAMSRIAAPFKKRAAPNAKDGACVGLMKSR